MDEERFEREHGERLDALRAARGDCPPTEQLLDWLEGELAGDEAAGIERHLTLCSACGEIAARAREDELPVDDVAWQRTARRLDERRAPWRRVAPQMSAGWVAAAAAAVIAAVVLLYRPGEEATLAPPAVSTTRDAEIAPIAPRGEVDEVVEFLWRGIPAPVRYRVEVAASGAPAEPMGVLWHDVTAETRLVPDASLGGVAEPGRLLRWRIVVLDEEGVELSRSDWVEFRIGG